MGDITKRVLFGAGVDEGTPLVDEGLASGLSGGEMVEVGKAAGSWLSIFGMTVLSFENCAGEDVSV